MQFHRCDVLNERNGAIAYNDRNKNQLQARILIDGKQIRGGAQQDKTQRDIEFHGRQIGHDGSEYKQFSEPADTDHPANKDGDDGEQRIFTVLHKGQQSMPLTVVELAVRATLIMNDQK